MKKIILIPVGVFSVVVLTIAGLTDRGSAEREASSPPPAAAASTPASGAAGSSSASAQYKDGTYTGDSADASGYGTVQVKVTVSGGRITDVAFLDYPQDASHSVEINRYAMPLLKKEAITAQSANVDIVSGASATSGAFQQSLQSALGQAS